MIIQQSRPFFEISRAFNSEKPIDLHKELKRSGNIQISNNSLILAQGMLPGDESKTKLEAETYLPFAAKPYCISADIKDYILVPVITIPADLPNRNEVAFPLKELVRFQPEYGVPSYLTFRGKPVHYEHDNQDITKAHGMIMDSYLRKFKSDQNSSQVWKLVELLAIDRTKYQDIAHDIITGELNTYSMGMYVGYYTCSYCGGTVGKNCSHLSLKGGDRFYEKDGKLVFMNCCDNVGFETSSVRDPAFVPAISDKLISYT